jgi:type III pantothenate kinase
MNLVVDIGNTFVKAAIFAGHQLIDLERYSTFSPNQITRQIKKHGPIESMLISSVRKREDLQFDVTKEWPGKLIELTHTTPLPIALDYETPETLGRDRIAAAVGAHTIFPKNNVLIIDLGTAITIDLINEQGSFKGGNISPGVRTRFRSLHEYTGALPLVKPSIHYPARGKNTKDALLAGVMEGIAWELKGYINQHKNTQANAKIIVTGGDAIFFDKYLKNDIFVDLNLNVKGLNRILEHNA